MHKHACAHTHIHKHTHTDTHTYTHRYTIVPPKLVNVHPFHATAIILKTLAHLYVTGTCLASFQARLNHSTISPYLLTIAIGFAEHISLN